MGAPTPHPLIKNLGKVGGEWGGGERIYFCFKVKHPVRVCFRDDIQ